MSVPLVYYACTRSQSVIVGVVSCGRKTKVRRSVQHAKFKLCEVAVEVEDG